ncbi:MAG: ATP-dependent helicase HrpB [Gammaproteobacteria bacterium]|nr:ATP-dependent helicase HrpB [Gammaproteobacteria bacterium]
MSEALPVEAALPALRAALAGPGAAVLEAPPGAGKSTRVPLALLDAPWLAGQRLLLLEPRRLAARAVAMRMASTLGEPVGSTVGYRMRLDTRISARTRLEVVTEGVLTRMLQADPALEGVGGILFDEFHERSLQADLGLALALDARRHLRPALRLLVMSATLDGAPLAQLLGAAPRISVPGRLFEVTTHWGGRGPPLTATDARGDTPERRVLALLKRALRETEGDVLVFLPGAREIRRLEASLAAEPPEPAVAVHALFGELGAAEQEAALAPAAGVRKVVLATNIAETSLTLPGVRAVVDSGLVRRPRFDPPSGMSRLVTECISRASAEQRQGRAGRVAPGSCYRAWGQGAHAALAAFTPPEIRDADLAPLALELAAWGAADAASLAWLDPPSPAMLGAARDLLRRLGALDDAGALTAHGRQMAGLGVHPRLAHLLLRAQAMGAGALGADLAALLSERDLLRGEAGRDADLRTRLALLRGEGAGADRGALERARRLARELRRQLGVDPAQVADDAATGVLLAFAYPDRIGRRRAEGEGRYALSNGRGASFGGPQSLAQSEFIVAADLEDAPREARIRLAAPLTRGELEAHFSGDLQESESVAWDPREEAVRAVRTVHLAELLIGEQPLAAVPPDAAQAAMLAGVRALGLGVLPWDRDAQDLRARVEFVRAAAPAEEAWPAMDDTALLNTLDEWLGPYLAGITRRAQLARVPLAEALAARLSPAQRRSLATLAPTHLTVPSGSRLRIDYGAEGGPALAVRLQEVFGLETGPLLGPARVPLTFTLLSPAQRPVQVTRDLAGFWRGSYAEVRRALRGRYPRHEWPEDPLTAPASRGARRRR